MTIRNVKIYRLIVFSALLPALLTLPSRLPIVGAQPEALSGRFMQEWGHRGSGEGEFDFPIGIVVNPAGEILVTDFYNARIQRFNANGKFLSAFSVLPNPGGIALGHDGLLYLTHFSAMKRDEAPHPDRVSVYSPRGELVRQWGKTGTGEGEFDYPGGLAVSKSGWVYVADQTNRRVQVFDSKGKYLFQWGGYGTGEGQFGGNVSAKSRVGGPQFVALDNDGNVYTTEASVGRVQKFTARGKFLLAWGSNDEKPGGFGSGFLGKENGMRGPVAICLDAKGRLWITAVSGRVQQFTPDGKYLRRLDIGSGASPGQFTAPHGIAVDGRGHLYVVDSYNHRIQKFAVEP